MAGLDPDNPKYIIAIIERGLQAVEDYRTRVAAERAAAIIRSELPPPLPPLPDNKAGRLAAELRALYGDRRPPEAIKTIAAKLREGGFAFSDRTLTSALALAWP